MSVVFGHRMLSPPYIQSTILRRLTPVALSAYSLVESPDHLLWTHDLYIRTGLRRAWRC